MATDSERGIAICNALVNGTASAALRNRLGLACARWRGRGEEYEAADNAGKAAIGIDSMHDILVGIVRHTEGTDAKEATEAQVDADFAPAPQPKP